MAQHSILPSPSAHQAARLSTRMKLTRRTIWMRLDTSITSILHIRVITFLQNPKKSALKIIVVGFAQFSANNFWISRAFSISLFVLENETWIWSNIKNVKKWVNIQIIKTFLDPTGGLRLGVMKFKIHQFLTRFGFTSFLNAFSHFSHIFRGL